MRDREIKHDSKENSYHRQRIAVTVHPNLRADMFRSIDKKEKAYWFGFLYSDGCIMKHRGSIRIQFKLRRDDEMLIDRFCECLGLEKSKKEYQIDNRSGREFVRIRFTCKEMGNDLLKHGLRFRKSLTIEYPKSLSARDFELAFLLGYYDGDGVQNTTQIVSGSKRFLEQIKDRFRLPYKIQKEKHVIELCGVKTTGTHRFMYLGAELFNEMMRNYTDSMMRKRWFPCTLEEKLRRSIEARTPEIARRRKDLQREWRAIAEDELKKLVSEVTLTQIAVEYNVSRSAVIRKCDRFGIFRPGRGYWAKRRSLEKESTRNQ